MVNLYLGIDIGTSGVKAAIVDQSGAVRAVATAPLAVSRPHDLWSEQAPADWWAATDAAVRQLDPALRGAVRGIGLAGQMHGATLLGEGDLVLRPANSSTSVLFKSQDHIPQLLARRHIFICFPDFF